MKRKGFTMLEILIVIIIIAILATFGIPQYLKASKRAIASEAITTIGAIRGAIARYNLEWNDVPVCVEGDCDNLDISNPNAVAGTNFSYVIDDGGIETYKITATGGVETRAAGICVQYDSSTGEIDRESADCS
ncbi:MAG: prepilin-type N-terminal cleavage/methylation domain-containing protein [Candidatus Kaelpia aquatica]|nr:prepilin-type N-terminal cleavage/methylation domain-containing protein [Candidatus Kaelpia aquatica]